MLIASAYCVGVAVILDAFVVVVGFGVVVSTGVDAGEGALRLATFQRSYQVLQDNLSNTGEVAAGELDAGPTLASKKRAEPLIHTQGSTRLPLALVS